MLNLSSSLYHVFKEQCLYVGFIYFAFGIVAAFAPIYIYMLLNVMPKVSPIYKYLLSSCGFSTIILALTRCLWVPIPTLPIMGVYSAGVIAYLGPTANLICLNVYYGCMVNFQVCCIFCLIFQFSALRPFSWVSHLGNCPTRVIICYLTYFFGMLTILTTLAHISVVDHATWGHYANQTNNEFVKEILKHQSSWIGFSSSLKSSVIFFGLFATLPDLFVAIFAVILTIKLYFIIEADKARVSTITQALERNLYRTFLFRIFCLVGLYTIPYMGMALSIILEYKNPRIGLIFNGMMISQSLVCFFGTAILIKNFRDFLFRCGTKKVADSSGVNSSSSDGSMPTTLTAATSDSLPPLRIKGRLP